MDEPNCNKCELADDLIKNLNIDVSISSVVGLDKQSNGTANRPRPIRITFDSPQVVLTVVKSKISLLNVPHWKNSWITTDLTIKGNFYHH